MVEFLLVMLEIAMSVKFLLLGYCLVRKLKKEKSPHSGFRVLEKLFQLVLQRQQNNKTPLKTSYI